MSKAIAALCGVSKRYRNGKWALRDVDLELRAGEITTLLGPNGAGKTTAIKILLGLAAPSSGQVSVFGADPRGARNRVRTGTMMQVSKVPEPIRVREHIDIFRSYYPRPLTTAATLETTGIAHLADRWFGHLSGGEKQRVMLALALCGNPDLLFLDEPTVGVDVEARHALWNNIRAARAAGRAVLLTTHYLEEAELLADRVVVLNHGRIIADGPVSEIRQRVGLKRIRCTTTLTTEQLHALPNVSSVARENDTVEIMTPAAESVVRELLQQDPMLARLEITGAGLEAAFLELTRSALSEAS